jgi:hypothetical protein
MSKLAVLIEELEELTEAPKKKWIQKAIKHKGALKKTLGLGKDGKIPVKKLKKAAHGSGKTAKRARLAMTLKKLNK